MPLDFAGYTDGAIFGSDPFGSPFGGTLSAQQIPPDRGPGAAEYGFFRTLLNETMMDVKGAGKLIGALGSETLGAVGYWDLIGQAIPLEFDDLSKRDYTGAVMIGAMVAGGFLAKAARSIPTVANFAKQARFGQTTVDAGVEFLVGMAYGTLRPIEDDESRAKAMFGDAALFGAFGVGFNVVRAASRATFGKVWAGMRSWDVHRSAIKAAESVRDEQIIFELAGVRLRNPDTGASVRLSRNTQNLEKIDLINFDATGAKLKGKGATERFGSFNEAMAEAFRRGHVERMGVARPKIPGADAPLISPSSGKSTFRGNIETAISSPATLLRVQAETGELLLDQLDNVRFEEYAAVRELVNATEDVARVKSLLGVEEVIPLNELGLFEFATPAARADVLGAIPGSAREMGKLSDHELLQRAVLNDVVDIKSIEGAAVINESLKDILLSGYIPKAGADVTLRVQPLKDLAFRVFTTTDRIMSNYPFMREFGTYVRTRTVALDEARQSRYELLRRLRERHKTLGGDEVRMRQIADIIDDSGAGLLPEGVPKTLDAAELLKQQAAATGDDVARFDFSRLLPPITTREFKDLLKNTPDIRKKILDALPDDELRKLVRDDHGGIRANTVKALVNWSDDKFAELAAKSPTYLSKLEKDALKIFQRGDRDKVLLAVREASLGSIKKHIGPDGKITVYRGETRPKGARKGPTSVSLSPQVAARFAVDNQSSTIRAFKIDPEDVIMDVSASGGRSGITIAEREFLVDEAALGRSELLDLDALRVKPSIEESRLRAAEAARATGDPEITAAVEDLTEILAQYADALGPRKQRPDGSWIGIDRLKDPRLGYFPIFNVGKWRVGYSLKKGDQEVFHGFYNSNEEAMKAATELLKDGTPFVHVGPKAWVWTDDLLTLEPQHYGRLQGKMRDAAEDILDADDFKAFQEALEVRPGRAAPKTYAGILRERTLGIRDFANQDIFETMSIYMGQADRVVALHEFENNAMKMLDRLPRNAEGGLANLREWGERLVDDVMGRPTRSELIVERTIKHLKLDEYIKPRALKRWAGAVRGWQSFARLGGLASGAVNLTQIAFNTTAVVGPRYTAIAMGDLFNPRTGSVVSNFARIRKELVDLGVDQVEMFVPLAQEGGLMVHPQASSLTKDITRAAKRAATATKNRQYKDALRDYKNTVSTTFLFAFNGAERVNRVVTARAQYLKSIADQKKRGTVISRRAAAVDANRAVSRTQFDYRMSNMPELFRDPAFATAFQFKSFLVNEIDFIAHLNGPELRRFTLALGATGGVSLLMNMAPVDMLDAAGSVFFDRSISEAMAINVAGDRSNPLAKAISYGLPGLIGVNLTDYAGIGSLKEITRGLYGPSISDAKSTYEFFTESLADLSSLGAVRDETYSRFIQKVQPSAYRRLRRGLDIVSTGRVNDPVTGNLIYKPAQRNRTAFFTGVGFPTLEYSQRRAIANVAGRVKDRYIRANRDLSREAAESILEGRGTAVQNIRNRARDAGFELTDRSIKYQLNNLQRDASERVIRRTPTQRRDEVIESMEITGTMPDGYNLPEPKSGGSIFDLSF